MTGTTMGFDAHLEDMNVVTLFGLSVLSHGVQKGSKVIKRQNFRGLIKIYLKEDDSINGVQIIGDVSRGGLYLSLMRKGTPVSEKLNILSAHLNYGFTLSNIKYL
jgi:NAD(P)H-nitrite reductase large subunit